jgi:hypothetical protein
MIKLESTATSCLGVLDLRSSFFIKLMIVFTHMVFLVDFNCRIKDYIQAVNESESIYIYVDL